MEQIEETGGGGKVTMGGGRGTGKMGEREIKKEKGARGGKRTGGIGCETFQLENCKDW